MADVVFTCSGCSHYLVADSAKVGQVIECPDCGQSVLAPNPEIFFNCPRCMSIFCATSALAGLTVECAKCRTPLMVPTQKSNLRLRKDNPDFSDDTTTPVIELRRKTRKTVRLSSVLNTIAGWVMPLVILGLIGGGVYYWINKQKEEERNNLQQEHEAEVERLNKKKAEQLKANQIKLEQEKCEAEKAEQLRKNRMAVIQALYFDNPDINLFDALLRLSIASGNASLSIDPDAVAALTHAQVKAADFLTIKNPGSMNETLGQHGVAIYSCPVSEYATNRASLITTEPIWSYSLAAKYLQKRQLAEALKVLNGKQMDNTEFGQHALALRAALSTAMARQSELDDLTTRTRNALAHIETLYKPAQVFWQSPRRLQTPSTHAAQTEYTIGNLSRSDGKPNFHSIDPTLNPNVLPNMTAQYENAQTTFLSVCGDMQAFCDKLTEHNKALCARFAVAYSARLYPEADYWLANYIENFSKMNDLLGEISKSSIIADTGIAEFYQKKENQQRCVGALQSLRQFFSEPPASLRLARQKLESRAQLAAAQNNVRPNAAATNEQRRLLESRACLENRGDLFVRAITGVFRTQTNGKTIQSLLAETPTGAKSPECLAHEFSSAGKVAMLNAIQEMTRSNVTVTPVFHGDEPAGHATGLCACNASVSPFVLSVSLKPPVNFHPSVPTPYVGYWAAWSATEHFAAEVAAKPIWIEGGGAQNELLCDAANEVYKWAVSTYGQKMSGQIMNVSIRNLLADQVNVPDGALMAVAAYSCLFDKPIRPDTSVSGTFSCDGSVHRIHDIYEKICGVGAIPKIELLVLPSDNEPDIKQVPFDVLCRVVIITTDNIQTYIKYATDPSYNQDSIKTLRKAQLLLLTGKSKEAESLLLDVAVKNPDIYTAKRLLEFSALVKKSKE